MRRYLLSAVSIILITAGILTGCNNPFDHKDKSTRVTLRAVNSTVLFSSSDKMILCIHDEQDHDRNYSQYTTNRSVTFDDVKPGKYMAHFGANWTVGERAIRIEVREEKHTVVTFEGYIKTYVTDRGIDYPIYAMKAYVE